MLKVPFSQILHSSCAPASHTPLRHFPAQLYPSDSFPAFHLPFRSTIHPSGPPHALPVHFRPWNRPESPRTGIFHVLDSYSPFQQTCIVILLELSILLCYS